MKRISVPIIKLPNAYDFSLPQYAHELASSVDLQAAVNSSIRITPNERVLVPTGICLALPLGVEAQLRTHAKTALELGLIVCDSPSGIDAAYRDEVKCLIYNTSPEIVIIRRGMFIATMSFAPVLQVAWQEIKTDG